MMMGIGSAVIGTQSGLEVTYFNSEGNPLPSPLPNPRVNTVPYRETITISVSDLNGNWYTETKLEPHTPSAPEVDTPSDLFFCAKGNGYLDTSLTGLELIGEQIHLMVTNCDGNGDPIPPCPILYHTRRPLL